MLIRIVGVVIIGLVGFVLAYHNAKPNDPRDPRCDTAARYQAMSEGANCS